MDRFYKLFDLEKDYYCYLSMYGYLFEILIITMIQQFIQIFAKAV